MHHAPMAEGKGSAQGPGALAGLRVIDLTRVLGGPYCTMVLSDHGAEVIKLEPPQGDETREWGPPFDEAGDASYFIGINRNKQSVGLDLSKPAGRKVLMPAPGRCGRAGRKLQAGHHGKMGSRL